MYACAAVCMQRRIMVHHTISVAWSVPWVTAPYTQGHTIAEYVKTATGMYKCVSSRPAPHSLHSFPVSLKSRRIPVLFLFFDLFPFWSLWLFSSLWMCSCWAALEQRSSPAVWKQARSGSEQQQPNSSSKAASASDHNGRLEEETRGSCNPVPIDSREQSEQGVSVAAAFFSKTGWAEHAGMKEVTKARHPAIAPLPSPACLPRLFKTGLMGHTGYGSPGQFLRSIWRGSDGREEHVCGQKRGGWEIGAPPIWSGPVKTHMNQHLGEIAVLKKEKLCTSTWYLQPSTTSLLKTGLLLWWSKHLFRHTLQYWTKGILAFTA